MTLEKCATYCGNANFEYFGVEYAHECFCGNQFTPGAAVVDQSECDQPCAGDGKEICGGPLRLSVYKFDG
jgi:hypothetical protein